MPKGPKGQKRPADVITNAVHVMRIATREVIESSDAATNAAAVQLGKMGGKARAKALSSRKKIAIATNAAKVRWSHRKRQAGRGRDK